MTPEYRPYDEIAVGETAGMEVVLDEPLVSAFSALIGDTESFHVSDEAAERTIFKKRIAHGVHLLAYVSVTIGQKLPGFGTIYVSQELAFHKPVYLGETIRVRIEVLEKLGRRRLRVKTDIFDALDRSVMTGEAVVKTYR